jgi:hypothetical protein
LAENYGAEIVSGTATHHVVPTIWPMSAAGRTGHEEPVPAPKPVSGWAATRAAIQPAHAGSLKACPPRPSGGPGFVFVLALRGRRTAQQKASQ